jgi:transposase
MLPTLGIDIGKLLFHVELLINGKLRHRKFNNNPQGFVELAAWLTKQQAPVVHACMEATGTYGNDLALYLYEQGHTVSVVNPAQIKYFGQSELSRNKDDQPDAAMIRRFCAERRPRCWTPPTPEARELQALSRHRDSLLETRQQLVNRLDVAPTKAVEKSLRKLVAQLDAEIKRVNQQLEDHIKRHPDLKRKREQLLSIPGLGKVSATQVLAEIENPAQFSSARELAAYAGLTPRNIRSGTLRGTTRLSKTGNARLRKALFLPAMTAKKYNPIIGRFCTRLARRGKTKMQVVGAAMRKLIHMIYGVLKSGQNFNPDHESFITKLA